MPTNQTPYPEGEERSKRASKVRKAADKIRAERPRVITRNNGEEDDYAPSYIANFTKGLPHDEYGIVKEGAFETFRNAINKPEWHFDVPTGDMVGYCSTITIKDEKDQKVCFKAENEKGQKICFRADGKDPKEDEKNQKVCFRTWESPRGGHVYDLQGPDAGDVGMAPAPRLDSCELAVEMAEVYAAALLRDVPFPIIETGGAKLITKDPDGNAEAVATAKDLIKLIGDMDWFQKEPASPCCNKPTRQETNRREARKECGKVTPKTFLRGSAPGAKKGPFLSQFLLIGNEMCTEQGKLIENRIQIAENCIPKEDQTENKIVESYIRYGTQVIDQRVCVHKVGVDFMTDWCSWLDVQNGADVSKAVDFEPKRRFITTPRDLATYVHYDALYQAYLNACLIMMGLKIPYDKGFPEGKAHPTRDAFATFGGPHILSLLTEVATRALKAVRRQKFNQHCRARPEAIGGLLTAYENMPEAKREGKFGKKGGKAVGELLKSLPSKMLEYVDKHNGRQNSGTSRAEREKKLKCPDSSTIDPNLLLPMAFPEGSPMHPSYGAGHATVAGACVTILKAFFEMYKDDGTERELYKPSDDGMPCADKPLDDKTLCAYKPSDDGMSLEPVSVESPLTVQGELNKLAANISIGRNMAGVHYYSDYYDSLRMGERIAVGILQEQIITYGEKVSMTFETFDGEVVALESQPGSLKPLFRYHSGLGSDTGVVPPEWWTKHVY